jgi:hypothetical protein
MRELKNGIGKIVKELKRGIKITIERIKKSARNIARFIISKIEIKKWLTIELHTYRNQEGKKIPHLSEDYFHWQKEVLEERVSYGHYLSNSIPKFLGHLVFIVGVPWKKQAPLVLIEKNVLKDILLKTLFPVAGIVIQ